MIRSLTGEMVEPNSKFSRNVMFSSQTDEWETPQDMFDALDKEFHFNLDPCATPENAKCEKFFTKEQNGLIQDWGGHSVFVNNPYSDNTKWVRKAYRESLKPNTRVVMLLPSRTDTKWFHKYCIKGTIWFIKGRLKFGGQENSAPFPSMVVIFPSINKQSKRTSIDTKQLR